MTGLATITPGQTLGTTVVTLNITGGTPGTYVWHVHVGNCGARGGAILGDKGQYPTVKVDNSGKGTARATLSAPPPAGGNYHVVVHAQNGNEQSVQSCGNLLESGV